MPKTSPNTPPVAHVRYGLISAAIWENQLEDGEVRFSVTLDRRYHDGKEWKSSASFGQSDLLLAAKVLDHTHTKVCEIAAARRQR